MMDASERERIDINLATAEELARVDGIGAVLARRIVDYRVAHGPFGAVADLVAVQGVGPLSLAAVQDQLTVGATLVAEARHTAPRSAADAIEWPAEDAGAGLEVGASAVTAEQGGTIEASSPAEAEPEAAPAGAQESPRAAPIEANASVRAVPHQAGPSGGIWSGWKTSPWALVLLGGLLGVVLTLVVLLLWSGTVSFASRREVQALSQNMDVMQTNAELAWQRIDELSQQNADLERRLAQVEPLTGRVATLEGELATTQEDLATAQAGLADMQGQVQAAQDEIGVLGQRLGQAEETLADVDARLSALSDQVSTMQARMTRFDTFFGDLRDLLIGMEGLPPVDTSDSAAPASAPTQTPETATPSPTAPATATPAVGTPAPTLQGTVVPTPALYRS